MAVDTAGLMPEHVGKRLWVELSSGESLEIELLELTVCEKPEPCCGITYKLQSTNRRDGTKQPGSVYWSGFSELKSFQVLGE